MEGRLDRTASKASSLVRVVHYQAGRGNALLSTVRRALRDRNWSAETLSPHQHWQCDGGRASRTHGRLRYGLNLGRSGATDRHVTHLDLFSEHPDRGRYTQLTVRTARHYSRGRALGRRLIVRR